MLGMLADSSALVVTEALYVLTESLKHVQNVPKSDAFVFVEFILPELQKVSTDPNPSVRVALAANLGSLAESALRYGETIFKIAFLRKYHSRSASTCAPCVVMVGTSNLRSFV